MPEWEKSYFQESCKKILNYFGIENQTIKAMEECSELSKAIAKGFFFHADSDGNIAEEIADVTIMCEQIKQAFLKVWSIRRFDI